jgi:hypothetical protein
MNNGRRGSSLMRYNGYEPTSSTKSRELVYTEHLIATSLPSCLAKRPQLLFNGIASESHCMTSGSGIVLIIEKGPH